MPDNMKGEFNSKLATKDMLDVQKVFDNLGIKSYLAYGAVLGAIRHKDFIPWDDDIDFAIVEPISYELRKKAGWQLIDLGFKPQPISFRVFDRMEPSEIGYNGDASTGIIVCERNVPFSIFFYRPEGEDYICIPKLGGMKLLASPKKFYGNHTLKFKGRKFFVPGPVEEYLTHTYGDWKTPVKGYHAPQYQINEHGQTIK